MATQRTRAALFVLMLFAGCGQSDPQMAARDASSLAGPALPLLIDIDGINHGSPAAPAPGKWTSLFFVGTDCPVSNRYVPEIKRICAQYAPAGIDCLLVYSDRTLDAEAIREHLTTYEYGLPAVQDATRAVANLAGATITPEVAVFGADAKIAYRGRIDDLFGELGRPRQRVSQHDLRDALEDLVAGRPVRNPRTQAIGCYIEQ
jgi:hypothetical protein